jgi:hypothetical protein
MAQRQLGQALDRGIEGERGKLAEAACQTGANVVAQRLVADIGSLQLDGDAKTRQQARKSIPIP